MYTVKKETGVAARLLDINWRPCSRTRFDLKPFFGVFSKKKIDQRKLALLSLLKEFKSVPPIAK